MIRAQKKSVCEKVFQFTKTNTIKIAAIIKKYPKGKQKSSILSLLYIAQEQNGGHLSVPSMDCVASILGIPPIQVYEVATFYTMFYLQPMGKNIVQVCTMTSCWLRGSDKILLACKKNLGIDISEMTGNGDFTLLEAECLGACVNAPVMQINGEFYENITVKEVEKILRNMKEKNPVKEK